MRRFLSVLVCTGALLSCRPAIQTAGHTLTPEEEALKTGSARRPAVPAISAATTSPDGSLQGSVESPPIEEPAFADLPPGGRVIGDSKPVAVEGLGRAGHWVAHCSLPPGTKLGPRGEPLSAPSLTLTIGDKAEAITALLRSSEDGRHLVILNEGRAWLIDAVQNKRADLSPLSPDLRADKLPDHRSFAFTRSGLVVLSNSERTQGYYLPLDQLQGDAASLVARAHPVYFGKRPVWRVEAKARSFWATTIPEDSAAKQWPVPLASQPSLRCLAPSAPYDAYERVSAYRPDPLLRHTWARAPSGDARQSTISTAEAPGFVAPFDSGWVRREDDGRLLLVRGRVQEQIASSRCGGRILGADENAGLFLVSCEDYSPVPPKPPPKKEKPKYRFDLYLLRPGLAKGLGADTARTGVDFLGSTGDRLFPLRPGAQAALVDFGAGRLVTLEGDVQVLATGRRAALLRRGNKLSLWTKRGEEPVDAELNSFTQILTQEGAVSVGSTMFVLDDQLRTWSLPETPLTITQLGVALIAKKPPTLETWPEGPLLLLGAPSDP